MAKERIQKALASAGVAGRRTIEQWIGEGRITVNGRPAEIGQSVDHDDHIRVDGRPIALSRKAGGGTRVLLYRKRVGEVVTREDPDGRRTVFRKLPELTAARWIAVGRLDINTSGLLLLTTDGELARRLMHPSFQVSRTYAVRVLGDVTDEALRTLKKGVTLEDGPARCESIRVVDPPESDEEEGPVAANRWLEVTMQEGRNRIVRRLFESVGLTVSRLIRIAYGPIHLGRGIKTGSYREAEPEELAALRQAVGLQDEEAEKPAPRRGAAKPGIKAAAKPEAKPPREPKAKHEQRKPEKPSRSPRPKPAAARPEAKPKAGPAPRRTSRKGG